MKRFITLVRLYIVPQVVAIWRARRSPWKIYVCFAVLAPKSAMETLAAQVFYNKHEAHFAEYAARWNRPNVGGGK